MLVAMAAINPRKSKLISFTEHKARPPITGIKDKFTYKPVCSPIIETSIALTQRIVSRGNVNNYKGKIEK